MPISAWLMTIPQWCSAILVIGSYLVAAIGLILIIRKLVHHSILKQHNDIAGFIFASLGVIYGVVLAFVVIDVWEEFNEAKGITEQEAGAALALYRGLTLYPNQEEAGKALKALHDYTLSVINKEFPAMHALTWDSATQANIATQEALDQLNIIWDLAPKNFHEQSLFNELLRSVNQMTELRARRLLLAKADLPNVIWGVVVFGGLITVGFVALFGHEKVWGHIVLASLLSLITGGVIYVAVSLNFPFLGEVSIQPEGYHFLIELAGW